MKDSADSQSWRVRPLPGGCGAEQMRLLRRVLEIADAVVIGAGAGLSTSAGFAYGGERFTRYFTDFGEKYGFHDMYAGGFWPYETPEEYWAYWSRYVYINRYMDPPRPVYDRLYELVREKDYFVITTNVDHCFQKAGFSKERLFYTQGDYGLFQCSGPCHAGTYDNAARVRTMLTAQGLGFDEKGGLKLTAAGRQDKETGAAGRPAAMRIPSGLVPRCPRCGRPMSINLRADDTFVEDEGWHAAAGRYQEFLRQRCGGRVLYLELGVGYNTPGIIKYPFWQLTYQNPKATYVCINRGAADCPREIRARAICMDADIGDILERL